MEFAEISLKLKEGKYVVWVDDKQDAPLTPEYLEAHFVAFADSTDDGYELCGKLQKQEREQEGRATTRYRISGLNGDYVCSEDLSAEDAIRIAETLPMAEEDRRRVAEQLKKQ